MDTDFYTGIGFIITWCMKYIFIPFGVAFTARILAEKALRAQPVKQRKKRFHKNRL